MINWKKRWRVALHQVEGGAQAIDINMDDGMLEGNDYDGTEDLIASDPEIYKSANYGRFF